MPTYVVTRESLAGWLGDHHGLTDEGVAELLAEAPEITRRWPNEWDAETRRDCLWSAYQRIVTAAASSSEEALNTIHGKGYTGVDPWQAVNARER